MDREACQKLYRLYMGPQVITFVLGRLKSVSLERKVQPLVYSNFLQCRQPVLADEIQTFKALITVHKVLQGGHGSTIKEAQANTGWLESLTRGVGAGESFRGIVRLKTTR